MPEVLALVGSLRAKSVNLHLVQALGKQLPAGFCLTVCEGLQDLPQFNPDLDTEDTLPHPAVARLRKQVQEASAVLICTPEYAAGVPGFLKNALDWLVSSGELVEKPVAVVSASPFPTGGDRAHASLLGTLQMMTAQVVEGATLTVPLVNTRINGAGEITDGRLQQELNGVVQALCATLEVPSGVR